MLVLTLAYAADDVCSSWSPSELAAKVGDVPTSEASGLARWGSGLLTLADSSGNAELYEIDASGEFARTIPIDGATNTDWEDLAVAPCDEGECAFIADIGDNDGIRGSVTIWRVPLGEDTILSATACTLEYENGEPHDAEALLYFPDGSVRVVTKGSDHATVFRSEALRCDGGTQVLTEEVKLELGEPVTGGTVSADGSLVALRGLTTGWVWRGCVLDWSVEPTELLFVGEDQGEGFTVNDDGSFTSSSEGDKFELHDLPCTASSALVCEDCGCAAGGEGPGAAFGLAVWAAGRRRRR